MMNRLLRSMVLATVALGALGFCTFGQTAVPTSVDATLVLDAAGPEQRKSLSAIYLIACPGVGIGSGFLLEAGVIITNSHVVATCTEKTLYTISTANKTVTFSNIIRDTDRDLAILIPTEKLTNGLKLAGTDTPAPGTAVTTWGYPFLYNGTSPLLSVGYVSGFRKAFADSGDGKSAKHIIVNGAFNHGNSGGPLLVAHDNEVIGVVVLTYNFYPPEVKKIIDALSVQQFGLIVGHLTAPDGSNQDLSEARVTGMVLDEFYQKTQVMIGEAVAASELAALLKEHAPDLPSQNGRPSASKAPVVKK
jgi:hypothetical protein